MSNPYNKLVRAIERYAFGSVLLWMGAVQALIAQAPQRPHILGISQIAFYMHDCDKSRAYYGGFLGLEQVYPTGNPCDGKSTIYYRINERQFVELLPEREPRTDRLDHIALQTDNVETLRAYLAAKGIAVPRRVKRDRTGTLSFRVTDPEGHVVEMLQYKTGARLLRVKAKVIGAQPISDRMAHVGLIVTNLPAEYSFYTDVLGFKETYRGSMNGSVLSWVNLKVPDGDDYLEFMLYRPAPDATHRGSAHHFCLQVTNVPASVAELEKRPYFAEYQHPLQIHIGVNRKRQVSLFDPDGTRAELMEPHTIDGKPAVSTNEPAP